VPIERAATLKAAEKLLRQGKLDQAIAEYLRIVDDQPSDWNTANLVGDLYVRAGKPDKAIEQFVASADSLSDAGALPKAAALYKKILKLRPEHEHALLQCAEIAATQGVLVDARSYLKAVADRRRARGDQRGVAQITIRLASLDSQDLSARLAGARARLEVKDQAGAVRDLKEIAAEFLTQERAAEAIDVLREAIVLVPEDHDVRQQLLDAFVAAGDHVSAREHARTSEQLQLLASHLEEGGHADEARGLLEEALAIDPSDARLLARLNRTVVAEAPAEDVAPVAEGAPEAEVQAPAEPESWLEALQDRVRAGRIDQALPIVRQLLEREPQRRDEVALVGLDLCAAHPDVAFAMLDLAADAAVAEQDWASAAAGLQEMVTRVPMYLPALMRLVEVCVDGGLEATMFSAQAQLADAYIEAGAAEEARFLAEDLVAREPWHRANIERFRRALELLGEPDPDALIAARLSGDEPFTSTDVSISMVRHAADGRGSNEEASVADAAQPVEADAPMDWPVDNPDFEFSAATCDDEPDPDSESDPAEVDLSVALSGMQSSGTPVADAPPDLEGVLGGFRDLAARRSAQAAAEEEYARGLGLHAIGRIDECVPLLTAASRAPNLRFATGSLLARIYREQGDLARAIEWLQRAAQAPPPSPEEGRLLMYDLSDMLETAGEYTRALAVCMDLQADAGVYRDVADRISRLTSMQIRG
jgi:tetratricopeptide (TPR) repeat protein